MKLNYAKLPSLLLAVLLQFAPLVKVFQSTSALASSPLAIVLRWVSAAAVTLGGYHAVSGASAAIKITSPTNSVGTNGTPYAYTITQSSPLTDLGHSFGATPLPDGLTVRTFQGNNLPAYGRITGTPTEFGVWLVHLTATYNDGGTILSAVPTNMLLTVYGKPIITNQPVSVNSSPGANVSFSVVAGALPAPTYRWRLGPTTLTDETNATLNLSNIDGTQAGDYTVVISNFVGSITSVVASLSVSTGTGVGITAHPHGATVLVGGSTNFMVAATGSPPLSYFWRKNGTPINGANSATYSLSNVSTGDGAGYSVVVSNAVNSVTSDVAVLNVVRPPVISSIENLGGQIQVGFSKDAGAAYELLVSPRIPTNSWQTLTNFPSQLPGTNVTVIESSASATTRFYLLRMTIP